MVLLDLPDHAELGRQLREALGLSGLGKALVHIGPLVVLAIGSGTQVLGSGTDPLQFLEPHLGVLFLVVGGHIVVGTAAPEVCPVCAHPQAYFEVHAENY